MKRTLLLTGTFFIISTIYLFTLFSWTSLQTITHLLQRWGHQSEMTIYLRPEAKASEISQLKNLLEQYSNKINLSFQSKEDIQKNIKKLMPKSEMDFSSNDDLMTIIPPHIIITGTSNLFGSSLFNLFDTIKTEINKFTFIESSSYGQSWMDKYTQALNSLQKGTFIFLGVLALSIVLAIGNAIRSHINSRREEIEILELVGATPAMIRKPFLIEGALLSICSMIYSLTISTLIIYVLKNNAFDWLQFLDLEHTLHQFSLAEWIVAIILAAIVGFIGSYFCLLEINTGWASSEQGTHA